MRLTGTEIENFLPRPGFPGRPEDGLLDYKSGMPAPWAAPPKNGWEPKHECAKDVAALANHRGGHILVGIAEDRSTSSGQSLPGALTGVGGNDPEKQVKDWLNAALRPRELARRVDVYTVEVRSSRVVVVEVPAWDVGVALVEFGSPHDRLGYLAAVRDHDHTRFLDHRELEDRVNRPLKAQIAKLQAAGDIDLVVVDLQADEAGRVRIPVVQVRLCEEEQEVSSLYGMVDPAAYAGFVRPRLKDVVAYLDRKSRACEVLLRIENRGTATATDVEVRIDISNTEHVTTELHEPAQFPIRGGALADPDRNGTRNVTYESERTYDDGSARVVQRIKVIAPGSDADLVPITVVARGAEELPFKVEVSAVDSGGKRAVATFDYTLVRKGDVVVDIDDFR